MCRIPSWVNKALIFSALAITATTGHASCIESAAQTHNVNPLVLTAIARHESRLNPSIVVRNTNGTEDIGLTGINSVHLIELAKFSIGKVQLLDACINLNVGAWLLSKKIAKYGNTWLAIGAYHSETPEKNALYQRKIYAELMKLQ